MEKEKIIINGHEAVDLGLSVKWATCNIGATKPEECGDYFAWREISPKDVYTAKNYVYYDTVNNLNLIDTGTEISRTNSDAAYRQWGDDWRMPNEKELYELLSDCLWQWITINGVNGYKVIGPNGNSIDS